MVNIQVSDSVISSIESIEYILDQLTKIVKRQLNQKDNRFLIKGKVWSDFDLILLIHFKNGKN